MTLGSTLEDQGVRFLENVVGGVETVALVGEAVQDGHSLAVMRVPAIEQCLEG